MEKGNSTRCTPWTPKIKTLQMQNFHLFYTRVSYGVCNSGKIDVLYDWGDIENLFRKIGTFLLL